MHAPALPKGRAYMEGRLYFLDRKFIMQDGFNASSWDGNDFLNTLNANMGVITYKVFNNINVRRCNSFAGGRPERGASSMLDCPASNASIQR